MASNLAIDTSDVDLQVIGLDFNKDKNQMIFEMKYLHDKLLNSKFTSLIHSCKLIETATIPVIKLQVDLQAIREKT